MKDLKAPLKVFDGSAREGARGFPANVNVAAALSLAGIGPDKTRLEIWPIRRSRAIPIASKSMPTRRGFRCRSRTYPSENPRTGRITALSTVAALRGLVAELKVGT